MCDFAYEEAKFRIICVYAPTDPRDQLSFFQELCPYFETNRQFVVLGDFNCVLCADDRYSCLDRKDESANYLKESIDKYSLQDVAFFAKGGLQRHYTRFQGSSHARLGRAYVVLELANVCDGYGVEHVSFSDPSLVMFSLGQKEAPKRAFIRELWKLNAKLLHKLDTLA